MDDRPNAEFPDRPDHQDFRDMAAIVRELDQLSEIPSFDMHELVAKYVDPESLVYLIRQRTMRLPYTDQHNTQLVAGGYTEGLLVGLRLAEHRRNS